jgi:hypothetical protein
MRALLVAVAMLFATSAVYADETCSANGRFCLSYIATQVDDGAGATHDEYTARVVERGDGPERVIATFPYSGPPADVLLSDDGRYLVFAPEEPARTSVVTIRRTDGTVASSAPMSELLSPHDLEFLWILGAKWSLRGDRIVLSLRTSTDPTDETREDIEIAMSTGKRVTPMRDVCARTVPRIEVHAFDAPARPWQPVRCVEHAAVTFATPNLVHVDSDAFLSMAIETPLVEYPTVAMKARISGRVYVEAVVDDAGNVTCVRTSPLPFGIDAAAAASVMQWKFRRFRTSATVIAPVIGTFDLHYLLVRTPPIVTQSIQ